MANTRTPLWATDKRTQIDKRKGELGELVLMTAFVLFCVKYILDISAILPKSALLDAVLVVLMISLPIIKVVLLQHYSLVRLILTAATALIVGISCLISGNYLFLNGFFFALAMQDVDIDKVARLSIRFKTVCLAFHVISYIFAYNLNPAMVKFVYRAGSGPPRHSFFMGHANLFTSYLIWLSLEYIFIIYKKLNVFHIVVIWSVNLIFFYFTDTNTGLLVLFFTTVLIAFDKLGKGFFSNMITLIAKYGYLFLSILFAFLTAIYTRLEGIAKIMWDTFDNFMTGRLLPGAYAYEMYGFTLMGRHLHPQSVTYWKERWMGVFVPFDNYYLGNLYSFGTIHLLVITLTLIIVCGKMDSRSKIITIAFSFYGIMQKEIMIVAVCFVLFVIGGYIYPASNNKKFDMKGQEDNHGANKSIIN